MGALGLLFLGIKGRRDTVALPPTLPLLSLLAFLGEAAPCLVFPALVLRLAWVGVDLVRSHYPPLAWQQGWEKEGKMASAGYTLIEVIIVLLLLSILATIAWPALEVSLGRFLLEEAAQQLAREIRNSTAGSCSGGILRLTFILKSQYCLIVDSSGKRVTFTLPTGVKIEHTTFPTRGYLSPRVLPQEGTIT